MTRRLPRTLFLTLALVACAGRAPAPIAIPAPAAPALTPAEFGALIEKLSEPGGFFPSDNLVSNETSYLHVLGRMQELGVSGGAYLGVGPDQNFSYIAQVRPEIVFFIDIRRDNLLQHLLFKAVFELSRNRLEYLCLMTGKPVPKDLAPWDTADVVRIIAYVDSVESAAKLVTATQARVREALARYGYALSPDDLANVQRIHNAFFEWGLDTRYSNRSRMPSYPSWRDLMVETDLAGLRKNYLVNEASFRYLKDLERRNLMIPVVGDLSGPHALAAIGQEITARGLVISAFYVSNVEQYLMQGPGFATYAQTVTALPFDTRSVIIRSFFRGMRHPLNVLGHASTQLLERFETFAAETRAGGYAGYYELVTKHVLPLRN
jgi:hypothetical protein